MTVYVDDYRVQATVGRIRARWSHLMVGPDDDLEELHEFAARIGLKKIWFQSKSWPHGHYDVTDGKRRLAIREGAVSVTSREMARKCVDAIERRRAAEEQAAPAVHMAGAVRPFARCGSFDAGEPHTREAGKVTCPDCLDTAG